MRPLRYHAKNLYWALVWPVEKYARRSWRFLLHPVLGHDWKPGSIIIVDEDVPFRGTQWFSCRQCDHSAADLVKLVNEAGELVSATTVVSRNKVW